MSGFEVAGVVLGSIPIVVSALEFYIQGIGTIGRWRRFTLELEGLVLKLGTEEAKLQNVYEKLLRDIVPDDQIEPMLLDPFGPLWKEPATVARIRRRLWRHLKLFEDNVRRMNDAMEEMKQKLNIGPHGKVRWVEASGIKKQFKRVMFILQQDEYQTLLNRLREGVSSLEDLLSGNMELEPARYRGSQVAWYRLLRDLSASVYEALRSAVTCACPGPHDFGLRLMSQPTVITPNDDENEVVKSQKFQLIHSTASTTLTSEANLWATSKIWTLMSLSLSAFAREDTITATATATSAVTGTARRGLRFSLPTPEDSDMSQAGNSLGDTIGLGIALTTSMHGEGPKPINNLCQAMRRSRKQGVGECCGRIFDSSTPHRPRVYEVYPLGNPNDNGDWSPISLGAVLSGQNNSTLMYGDKLRLAWVITSSVLQLEGTPWISQIPSRDEIFVTQQDGVLQIQDIFVMKPFPESSPPVCNRVLATPSTTNKAATLKALGIILIELIFGQTIDNLRSRISNGPTSVFGGNGAARLSDYETAIRLMDQINTRVGSNYCSAVKRCINSDFYQGEVGFGGSPQKDVLLGVLTLLEQDLKAAMG